MIRRVLVVAAFVLALMSGFSVSRAEEGPPPTDKIETATKPPADRILGNADAPITVLEFVSLTCSHCAEFYDNVLPELEKRYVDTGKVKFILRDFPLDGTALKASLISRCMPAEQYYPFIKMLYKNQQQWAFGTNGPDQVLLQYAKLGGLSGDKAQACLQNTDMMDAIVSAREAASQKYDVEATPTFIINEGKEKVVGVQSVDNFAAIFDKLLGGKK